MNYQQVMNAPTVVLFGRGGVVSTQRSGDGNRSHLMSDLPPLALGWLTVFLNSFIVVMHNLVCIYIHVRKVLMGLPFTPP